LAVGESDAGCFCAVYCRHEAAFPVHQTRLKTPRAVRRSLEESSFSEEKEAKRLLFLVRLHIARRLGTHAKLQKNKSLFASFSSEKEASSCLSHLPPPPTLPNPPEPCICAP
jgi:hypothetical protein